MRRDFLRFLDEKQRRYVKRNGIENKGFLDYIVLKSGDLSLEKHFFIAKGEKSRILIEHNRVWVDLTDYDLIDLFCGMEEKTVKILLSDLKKGYGGEWTDFKFKVGARNFRGSGIDYKNYDLDAEVLLEADFTVRLGELLFVFNMVLNKDIVAENYRKREYPHKLVERTVMKYISLILYYKFGDKQAEEYLAGIKYPVRESGLPLEWKKKVKDYDECFEKKGFDKLLAVC